MGFLVCGFWFLVLKDRCELLELKNLGDIYGLWFLVSPPDEACLSQKGISEDGLQLNANYQT